MGKSLWREIDAQEAKTVEYDLRELCTICGRPRFAVFTATVNNERVRFNLCMTHMSFIDDAASRSELGQRLYAADKNKPLERVHE
jgi:hypothetical protein